MLICYNIQIKKKMKTSYNKQTSFFLNIHHQGMSIQPNHSRGLVTTGRGTKGLQSLKSHSRVTLGTVTPDPPFALLFGLVHSGYMRSTHNSNQALRTKVKLRQEPSGLHPFYSEIHSTMQILPLY